MAKFLTPYKKREHDYEVLDNTECVQRAGYIPPDILIKTMISAGQVFQANREQFDIMPYYEMDEEDHFREVMEHLDDDLEMRSKSADWITATEKLRQLNKNTIRRSELRRQVEKDTANVKQLAEEALNSGRTTESSNNQAQPSCPHELQPARAIKKPEAGSSDCV